jgi:predicted ATP-grasp superfamily ATP-dependent carboligase
VKPDDGAGCDGLERLDHHAEAERRIRAAGRLVAQPWLEGEPWSLSLLCAGGRARLLACNRQRLTWRMGRLQLDALAVNVRPPADPRVHRLGPAIASAIEGLWGYVGVDFLLQPDGPLVLEVNPRLTTSYCGLPNALGRNVAEMVLELQRSGELPASSPWSAKVVELAIEPEYAA